MSLQISTAQIPKIKNGEVWLVGAGPGDIGLLTLLAVTAIQSADYLVHDELINPEILKLTNENCELIYSGKRGGKPSSEQADISLKLVELAKLNYRVVRLKGGDPFVFGRGGEEALTLFENGVPFKVVPGVTSGVAGPAYTGIPITHREYNSVVSFVTGHHAVDSNESRVNWQALARTGGVIVFYMTLNRINLVAQRLIENGMKQDLPVALISNATTKDQKVLETTLAECQSLKPDTVEKPCLIVVGENVGLRNQLKWFE